MSMKVRCGSRRRREVLGVFGGVFMEEVWSHMEVPEGVGAVSDTAPYTTPLP